MCNCPQSPWVQRARELHDTNAHDDAWYAVDYLIRNNCGINNTALLDDVVNYVNEQMNTDLTREQFQQSVLRNLKRRGILVTLVNPGNRGGVFIPCDITEVETAVAQVMNRIKSELENIESSAEGTRFENQIDRLLETLGN